VAFRAANASEAKVGRRGVSRRGALLPQVKSEDSPYFEVPEDDWVSTTRGLIEEYPLGVRDLVDTVLESWIQIFHSDIGGFKIGADILPTPQIMGSFLHELIPLNFARQHPEVWRRDASSREKDLVCLTDDKFSTEIKTSSHPRQIFGNRSFAQETLQGGKKSKSGYYLAVNFSKFVVNEDAIVLEQPEIQLVRFGWLDHLDWAGQQAATGQQASLSATVENSQLLTIYSPE
jgi:hypothetical protein